MWQATANCKLQLMRLCLADGGDWWGGGEAITLTSIPRNTSMGQVSQAHNPGM